MWLEQRPAKLILVLISAVYLTVSVGACDSDKDGAQANSKTSAVAQGPMDSAEPRVPNFALRVEQEASYEAGQPQTFSVLLDARNNWHINQDYPTKLTLKSPEKVKVVKNNLSSKQARQFGEDQAVFDVSFVAEPGEHELIAKLNFALCTDEHCMPESKEIACKLKVQAGE